MLGVEDYGSGSENESDHGTKVLAKTKPQPKARKPKKIAIALPSLSNVGDDQDDLADERPAPKKPRLESGAGSSSLLSMLPAPKQNKPVPPSMSKEKVLGAGTGPGLVFRAQSTSERREEPRVETEVDGSLPSTTQVEESTDTSFTSTSRVFLPPSLVKGKSNISLEEPFAKPSSRPSEEALHGASTTLDVDFFSLGNSSNSSTKATKSSSLLSTVSSAPAIPEFEPPEPTQTDPYPGYYQLPSGAWAAYDPEYYAGFLKKWQKEYDEHVRALEKGTAKGFEGYDTGALEEVDTMKEVERARVELKEREDRKAVTMGASGPPAAPKMKMTASKMRGIARSRHQLATLLRDAYENREALEERIAQGKRNRKEAGNKYGF